jgi:transposase
VLSLRSLCTTSLSFSRSERSRRVQLPALSTKARGGNYPTRRAAGEQKHVRLRDSYLPCTTPQTPFCSLLHDYSHGGAILKHGDGLLYVWHLRPLPVPKPASGVCTNLNRNGGTGSRLTNAVGIHRQAGRVPVAVKPWVVSDELWERIEPLLPRVERRFRSPGRMRRARRGSTSARPLLDRGTDAAREGGTRTRRGGPNAAVPALPDEGVDDAISDALRELLSTEQQAMARRC